MKLGLGSNLDLKPLNLSAPSSGLDLFASGSDQPAPMSKLEPRHLKKPNRFELELGDAEDKASDLAGLKDTPQRLNKKIKSNDGLEDGASLAGLTSNPVTPPVIEIPEVKTLSVDQINEAATAIEILSPTLEVIDSLPSALKVGDQISGLNSEQMQLIKDLPLNEVNSQLVGLTELNPEQLASDLESTIAWPINKLMDAAPELIPTADDMTPISKTLAQANKTITNPLEKISDDAASLLAPARADSAKYIPDEIVTPEMAHLLPKNSKLDFLNPKLAQIRIENSESVQLSPRKIIHRPDVSLFKEALRARGKSTDQNLASLDSESVKVQSPRDVVFNNRLAFDEKMAALGSESIQFPTTLEELILSPKIPNDQIFPPIKNAIAATAPIPQAEVAQATSALVTDPVIEEMPVEDLQTFPTFTSNTLDSLIANQVQGIGQEMTKSGSDFLGESDTGEELLSSTFDVHNPAETSLPLPTQGRDFASHVVAPRNETIGLTPALITAGMVDTNKMSQFLAEKAQIMTKDGGGSVLLDIGTRETGKIEIAMDVTSNGVGIKIIAASDQVKEHLLSDVNKLREALQTQNLDLKTLDLSVRKDFQNPSNPGHSNQQNFLAQQGFNSERRGFNPEQQQQQQNAAFQSTNSGNGATMRARDNMMRGRSFFVPRPKVVTGNSSIAVLA